MSKVKSMTPAAIIAIDCLVNDFRTCVEDACWAAIPEGEAFNAMDLHDVLTPISDYVYEMGER